MDVFTPTPRNVKELERLGDVFSLALEIKTASKSGRLYHPNSEKLERVSMSGGLAVKMRTKQLQKKGAQTSEEVLSLFSFRRKI